VGESKTGATSVVGGTGPAIPLMSPATFPSTILFDPGCQSDTATPSPTTVSTATRPCSEPPGYPRPGPMQPLETVLPALVGQHCVPPWLVPLALPQLTEEAPASPPHTPRYTPVATSHQSVRLLVGLTPRHRGCIWGQERWGKRIAPSESQWEILGSRKDGGLWPQTLPSSWRTGRVRWLT
jgi:hypothetical protein